MHIGSLPLSEISKLEDLQRNPCRILSSPMISRCSLERRIVWAPVKRIARSRNLVFREKGGGEKGQNRPLSPLFLRNSGGIVAAMKASLSLGKCSARILFPPRLPSMRKPIPYFYLAVTEISCGPNDPARISAFEMPLSALTRSKIEF